MNDINELQELINKLTQQSNNNSNNMVKAAKTAVEQHVFSGLPTPSVGNKVRCVFNTGRKSFATDGFIPKEGRVYEVVMTATEVLQERAKSLDADAEEIAVIIRQHEENLAKQPVAEGYLIKLLDPATGETGVFTFPAHPSAVFIMVEDDAVDLPQRNDIPAGTPVKFSYLTVIGTTMVTAGKIYVLQNPHIACDCKDPDCPGRQHYVYHFEDDDGDLQTTSFPFTFMGVMEVVPQ